MMETLFFIPDNYKVKVLLTLTRYFLHGKGRKSFQESIPEKKKLLIEAEKTRFQHLLTLNTSVYHILLKELFELAGSVYNSIRNSEFLFINPDTTPAEILWSTF